MNAKEVALCSVFTALAIALDRFRIPLGPVSFYFWEIPIVIALLLFGFKFGFSVAALSAFGSALIFPRAYGMLFPIWNLIAMSTVLVAVSLVQRLITWRVSRTSEVKPFRIKPVIYFTAAAMAIRLAAMPFVNYFMYKFMMPIMVGPSFTDAAIMALIPGLLVFDAVLVLYTFQQATLLLRQLVRI